MKIGIIGGSGLYQMAGLERTRWVTVATPFGKPSDQYLTGRLAGKEVVFLPRHGRGHKLLPSELNHRANIYGMKKLGVGMLPRFLRVKLMVTMPPRGMEAGLTLMALTTMSMPSVIAGPTA